MSVTALVLVLARVLSVDFMMAHVCACRVNCVCWGGRGMLARAADKSRNQSEIKSRDVMLEDSDKAKTSMKEGANEARRTKLWAQSAMQEMMETSEESMKSISAIDDVLSRLSREVHQLVYERNAAEADVAALQSEVDKAG